MNLSCTTIPITCITIPITCPHRLTSCAMLLHRDVCTTLAASGVAQPHRQQGQGIRGVTVRHAMQNKSEIAGMVEAHLRDAVALCDHFSWFEEQMEAGKEVTEVELDEHLTACRAKQPGYIGPSFPTIAGCNSNGAIIHYRCAVHR